MILKRTKGSSFEILVMESLREREDSLKNVSRSYIFLLLVWQVLTVKRKESFS